MDAGAVTAISALSDRAASRIWPDAIRRPAGWTAEAARLVALGTWLAAAAVVVQGVSHLAVYDRGIKTLNADEEGNLWTWASSSATFVAAAAVLVLLVLRPGATLPFGVLAVALLYFSLDDAIGLHERIVHEHVGSIGPIEEGPRVVWPLVYLPMLAAVFGLLWTLGSLVPRQAGRLLRLGLGLLAGAIVAELVAAGLIQAGFDHFSFVYQVEVAIEEGMELAGWMLVATGLLATASAWAASPSDA